MKRYAVLALFAYLLVSLQLLAGCGGHGGGVSPEEAVHYAQQVSARIAPSAEAAAAQGTPEALAAAAQAIAKEAGVSAASSTNGSLTVEYANGGTEGWIVDPLPSVPPGAAARLPHVTAPGAAQVTVLREPVGNRRGLVLNAIAQDPGFAAGTSDMDYVAQALATEGYCVDRVDGPSAGVESFKGLASYGAIVVLQHGSATTYRGEPGIVVQTGQEGTWDDIRNNYASDWQEGRVSLRHVEWGTQDRPHTLKAFLSVTDRFFRHYYSDSKEFLPHSLIYDCACESLKNDSLADALIRSGAAAYVGWTESVSLASSTAVVLVIDMADGTNLEHAVATLPESLRHEGDAWLRYYPDPAGGTIQLGGDGRHAFQVYSDGNWDIYVMNEDGSNQTDLTNNPACDAYPAWSPDGSKIAFTSDRDGNYEIYVMNADGSKQTRLTNNTASDVGPVWSLDGSKIFFGSDRGGNWEIYVMNSDGSNQTVLTGGARGARTTTSMSSTRPEP